MKRMRRFLSAIFAAITISVAVPTTVVAATNIPAGDVGDFGTWATDNNRELVIGNMRDDISTFQTTFQKQLVRDYVPIEARIGMAFMNAMTYIGRILDNSLVRFMKIFLIVAYAFWIMFEAYAMMTGKLNAMETVENILKKGVLISVWVLILQFGPAKIFMWIMGPIISIGTYMSDMILNAIAQSAGVLIPDTCGAIHEYAIAHASPDMLVDANAAADIMCLPTRLSGFFYTGVGAGLKWMLAGIGFSPFTFVVGLGFVILFTCCIWKFALMALGVIADLFLAIFMLPFTALSETLGKTTYKGVAGRIFNGFLDLFKTENLNTQIMRFINAAIYFVSLSIVIGLCAAIMSVFISTDLTADVPTIDNMGFMPTLLAALLVWHMATKTDDIVKKLGGSIDKSLGDKFGGDITRLVRDGYNNAKSWATAIRESRKDK